METLKQWLLSLLSKLPTWAKWIVTLVIAALCAISFLLTNTACRTVHSVSQSSTSTAVRRGDTTITEVTIRYEQVGKASKSQ